MNGELVPTHRYVITFDKPDLPQSIKIADWHHELVDLYIPTPMQCIKCQKLGHTQKWCRKEIPTCSRCSEDGHQARTCANDFKCANCGGAHPSMDKKCPHYLYKSEILATQTRTKCTYHEAEDQVRDRYRQEDKRYNFAVKRPRQQTDEPPTASFKPEENNRGTNVMASLNQQSTTEHPQNPAEINDENNFVTPAPPDEAKEASAAALGPKTDLVDTSYGSPSSSEEGKKEDEDARTSRTSEKKPSSNGNKLDHEKKSPRKSGRKHVEKLPLQKSEDLSVTGSKSHESHDGDWTKVTRGSPKHKIQVLTTPRRSATRFDPLKDETQCASTAENPKRKRGDTTSPESELNAKKIAAEQKINKTIPNLQPTGQSGRGRSLPPKPGRPPPGSSGSQPSRSRDQSRERQWK